MSGLCKLSRKLMQTKFLYPPGRAKTSQPPCTVNEKRTTLTVLSLEFPPHLLGTLIISQSVALTLRYHLTCFRFFYSFSFPNFIFYELSSSRQMTEWVVKNSHPSPPRPITAWRESENELRKTCVNQTDNKFHPLWSVTVSSVQRSICTNGPTVSHKHAHCVGLVH